MSTIAFVKETGPEAETNLYADNIKKSDLNKDLKW
jgi:hypothetical protein